MHKTIGAITSVLGMLLLAACATRPSSAISSGQATILPGTSQADILSAKALIAVAEQRVGVSVYLDDCRKGLGTIRIDTPHYDTLTNLIATGTTPADRMFAKICADAAPMANSKERSR